MVAGVYYDANETTHLFVATPDEGGNYSIYTNLNDPAAVDGIWATGINNAGQIVGYYFDAHDNEHGFLYNNGIFTNLDPVVSDDPSGVIRAGAYGIDSAGQIVGEYEDGNFNDYGFLTRRRRRWCCPVAPR